MLQADLLFADRYRLIKRIGQGGFAEVWLADDTLADLQVAIKIYGDLDEDGLKIFVKEINKVYHLNHTNLLKPQYVAAWNNMPYLVMTYCSAGSLEKKIGQITEQEAWKILHDVASGLAYLHSNNIIHQDIKPANILQDDMGNYVIIDFGISTLARDTLRKSTLRSNTSAGTLAYMGPERFSKDSAPIFASDIWSLGAMLFELLEGRTPFPPDFGGGMQKAGAELPDITANVSQELKFVIYKMLSLNSWDRPTAVTLVKWANNKNVTKDTQKSSIQNQLQKKTNTQLGVPPLKTTLAEKIFQILTALWGLFVFILAVAFLIDDYDYLRTAEILEHIQLGVVCLALSIICILEFLNPNHLKTKLKFLIIIIFIFVASFVSLCIARNTEVGYYRFYSFQLPTMLSCLLLQTIKVIRTNVHFNKTSKDKKSQDPKSKHWIWIVLGLITLAGLGTIGVRKYQDYQLEIAIKDQHRQDSIRQVQIQDSIREVRRQDSIRIEQQRIRRQESIAAEKERQERLRREAQEEERKRIEAEKKRVAEERKRAGIGTHNGHEYVDLGLSVKWATCNIGATSANNYGSYFAWGETTSKSSYTWQNYKWYAGEYRHNAQYVGDYDWTYYMQKKYVTDSRYGSVDNKRRLDLSDDAANANWGGRWRTPTVTEANELSVNCTWEWIYQGGVIGFKGTSKINGKTIFLPAAGFCYCEMIPGGEHMPCYLHGKGESIAYWTSSLAGSFNADAIRRSTKIDHPFTLAVTREAGLSVRAVCP